VQAAFEEAYRALFARTPPGAAAQPAGRGDRSAWRPGIVARRQIASCIDDRRKLGPSPGKPPPRPSRQLTRPVDKGWRGSCQHGPDGRPRGAHSCRTGAQDARA
jgi:hypothetical protein